MTAALYLIPCLKKKKNVLRTKTFRSFAWGRRFSALLKFISIINFLKFIFRETKYLFSLAESSALSFLANGRHAFNFGRAA